MNPSRKKANLIFVNLIAPGISQFVAGRYVTGLIQFIAALVFFIWGLIELLKPLFVNISHMLQDKPGELEVQDANYYIRCSIPIGLLILTWLWSFIDIAIFYKPEEDKNTSKPNFRNSGGNDKNENHKNL